jgi:hypothetical protein
MSYFADLTPHTYTPTGLRVVRNVGWLDIGHPFPKGDVPAGFVEALGRLCQNPVHLHRGFHVCQFCTGEAAWKTSANIGNGQIRVRGRFGVWYAAPTMVHHYVLVHRYQPPRAFIRAVMTL